VVAADDCRSGHVNTVVRMGPADTRYDVGQALYVENSVHVAIVSKLCCDLTLYLELFGRSRVA
jgi:hypothetical protein